MKRREMVAWILIVVFFALSTFGVVTVEHLKNKVAKYAEEEAVLSDFINDTYETVSSYCEDVVDSMEYDETFIDFVLEMREVLNKYTDVTRETTYGDTVYASHWHK